MQTIEKFAVSEDFENIWKKSAHTKLHLNASFNIFSHSLVSFTKTMNRAALLFTKLQLVFFFFFCIFSLHNALRKNLQSVEKQLGYRYSIVCSGSC